MTISLGQLSALFVGRPLVQSEAAQGQDGDEFGKLHGTYPFRITLFITTNY